MKNYRFILLFFCFLTFFLTSGTLVRAELTEAQKQEQEARWRAELESTEKEIANWENILKTTKQGTASLQRDASVLQAKINEAKAFIKKRQIEIERLTNDISLKTQTIAELDAKSTEVKNPCRLFCAPPTK